MIHVLDLFTGQTCNSLTSSLPMMMESLEPSLMRGAPGCVLAGVREAVVDSPEEEEPGGFFMGESLKKLVKLKSCRKTSHSLMFTLITC